MIASATWGAAIKFISNNLVWRGPSDGRLFLSASKRKAVHCCTMFCSINISTTCKKKFMIEKYWEFKFPDYRFTWLMSARGSPSSWTNIWANWAPFVFKIKKNNLRVCNSKIRGTILPDLDSLSWRFLKEKHTLVYIQLFWRREQSFEIGLFQQNTEWPCWVH